MSFDLALRERLARWVLEDQAAGIERDPAEYLRRFPGREDLVARELEELLGEPANPSAAPGMLEAGGTFGRFAIEGVLGRGGQGRVLLARDPARGGERVAVKVVHLFKDPVGASQRLEREATRLRELRRHPGICKVHEVGIEGAVPWLCMEYVPGRTLEDWLERRGGAPLAREDLPLVLGWVRRLAEALEHAHRLGVLHRDVKASNVILASEGERVVLVDFGLAKDLREEEGVTAVGDAVGTPDTMAPEQTTEGPLDARVDVYALGLLLHRLLSGSAARPRRAPDGSVRFHHLPGLRDVRRRFGRQLFAVLQTATAARPGERYASAGEFARDLERLLAGRPVRASVPGLRRELRDWMRASPVLAMGASLMLLASLTVTAVTSVMLRRVEQAQKESGRRLLERDLALAGERLEEGRMGEALELLEGVDPARRGFEWTLLRSALYPTGRHQEDAPIVGLAVDGERCVLVREDGQVVEFSPAGRRTLARLELAGGEPVSIGPRGAEVLVLDRGDPFPGGSIPAARLHDAASGALLAELDLGDHGPPQRGQVIAGGRALVASHTGPWMLEFDRSGSHRFVGGPLGRAALPLHAGPRGELVLAHDTSGVAAAWGLYDLASRSRLAFLPAHPFPGPAALSPDRRSLYVTSFRPEHGGRMTVCSPRGQELARVHFPSQVQTLAVRPDGRRVAVAAQGSGGVHLLDGDLGRRLGVLGGARRGLEFLGYTQEGRLYGATRDGEVLWWEGEGGPARTLARSAMHPSRLEFSGDGRFLAVQDVRAPLVWYDLELGRIHEHWEVPLGVGFREGGLLVVGPASSSLHDPEGGWGPRPWGEPPEGILLCRVPELDEWLCKRGGELVAWPAAERGGAPRRLATLDPEAFHRARATGGRVVVWSQGGPAPVPELLHLDRVRGAENRHELPGVPTALDLHPAGDRVAVGFGDGSVLLLHLEREERRRLADSGSRVTALALHPSQARVAVARGPVVQLVDTDSGSVVLELARQQRTVVSLAFSPDGNQLAVGVSAGAPLLYGDLRALPPLSPSTTRGEEDLPAVVRAWRRDPVQSSAMDASIVGDLAGLGAAPRYLYERALEAYEGVRLGAPSSGVSQAQLLLRLGRLEEAEALLESLPRPSSAGPEKRWLSIRAMAAAVGGDRERAELLLAEAGRCESSLEFREAERLVTHPPAARAFRDWALDPTPERARELALELGLLEVTSSWVTGAAGEPVLRLERRVLQAIALASLVGGAPQEDLEALEVLCNDLLERLPGDEELRATAHLLGHCLGRTVGPALPLEDDDQAGSAWVLGVRAWLALDRGPQEEGLELFDRFRGRLEGLGTHPGPELVWLLDHCRERADFFGQVVVDGEGQERSREDASTGR